MTPSRGPEIAKIYARPFEYNRSRLHQHNDNVTVWSMCIIICNCARLYRLSRYFSLPNILYSSRAEILKRRQQNKEDPKQSIASGENKKKLKKKSQGVRFIRFLGSFIYICIPDTRRVPHRK